MYTYIRTYFKSSKPSNEEPACNCRQHEKCPVQGYCQKPIVYKATLNVNGEEKIYIGSTNNFKNRYRAHINSFKSITNQNSTTLSAYIIRKNISTLTKLVFGHEVNLYVMIENKQQRKFLIVNHKYKKKKKNNKNTSYPKIKVD